VGYVGFIHRARVDCSMSLVRVTCRGLSRSGAKPGSDRAVAPPGSRSRIRADDRDRNRPPAGRPRVDISSASRRRRSTTALGTRISAARIALSAHPRAARADHRWHSAASSTAVRKVRTDAAATHADSYTCDARRCRVSCGRAADRLSPAVLTYGHSRTTRRSIGSPVHRGTRHPRWPT
jgi:hypothetical protein